jgi:diketogulonate reductase-like aldo/keto reductase
MGYSPVGQGGKLLKSKVLNDIAKKHHMSPAQVALAWCMRKPVLAISKAGTILHVEENAHAGTLNVSDDDFTAIDREFPPPLHKQHLELL